MVSIIILNLISSFRIYFDGTFFYLASHFLPLNFPHGVRLETNPLLMFIYH